MCIDFITAGSRAGLINPTFQSWGIEKASENAIPSYENTKMVKIPSNFSTSLFKIIFPITLILTNNNSTRVPKSNDLFSRF